MDEKLTIRTNNLETVWPASVRDDGFSGTYRTHSSIWIRRWAHRPEVANPETRPAGSPDTCRLLATYRLLTSL